MTVVRILDWFRRRIAKRHIICPWCRCVLQEGDKGAPWEYICCDRCNAEWQEE